LEEDEEEKLLPVEFADHGSTFVDTDQMVLLHQLSPLPRQDD
jgi:hypothetical protein